MIVFLLTNAAKKENVCVSKAFVDENIYYFSLIKVFFRYKKKREKVNYIISSSVIWNVTGGGFLN